MQIKGIVLIIVFLVSAQAQVHKKLGFQLAENGEGTADYLLGNGIVEIVTQESQVWAATGYGTNRTYDGGMSWTAFTSNDYIGKGGVSAMGFMDDSTLWIASSFDTLTSDASSLPAGGGLSYTRNAGRTWFHIAQPVDSRNETEYSPTTTVVQNLTYDIAFLDSTIWITSWGGGLRKSSDMGQNWQVVTTDGIPFDVSQNNPFWRNHVAFSVLVENSNVWVGTAAGISKSSDGGQTWSRFNHQNQEFPISGNFIVALAYQSFTNTIWAATIEADKDTSEFRAVSKSDDGGETWIVMLEGTFPHNFAFNDSIVYVATDEGMYVSDDGGANWFILPDIRDSETGEEILTQEFYSAAISDEVIQKRFWAGSADGLASTIDNGNTWDVHRSFKSTSDNATPSAYAYPSPFSPSRHGYIRFQYDITRAGEAIIDIYDFSMDKVASIREYEPDPTGNAPDRSAKWDGRNDEGMLVASGVYFFRANIEGKITWGKLVIIN
jgi:photosystem II stability/assembly factor-like uncharacterized protein